MSYIRWGVLGLRHIGQNFCQSIRPVTNATLLSIAGISRNIDSLKTSTEISAQYSFQIQKISENIALRNQGENINLKFGLNESFNNALILDSWRYLVLH